MQSATDFDAVYSENAGFVWRVLRGMGVTELLVEDAVQDVFVVVYRRLPEFDGRHPVRTWIFAIAQRIAFDYRRRQQRAYSIVPLETQLRDHAPSPAETAERAESMRIVFELLEQLDDQKRAVFVLAEIEGMTAPEIAAATGTGLNTVYTRLRRARLQLNQALANKQKLTP